MKKIILTAILLALPLACFSQDTIKTQPLTLTIKSDKGVYRIGEEIKIVVTLKNNSNKEMIIYWPKGEPAIVSKETNVFTAVIDASMATELIYIKPKETFEKYISINLKTNLISGIYSIMIEYVPPIQFDNIFNIEKQEIWSAPLTSNTIQIEVKEKESSLSTEEEITLLRKKISDIESRCTPKEGASREEVERIFGKGKPAPIAKMPAHTATLDSPARSYEFCENGTLYVYYKDDKVLWSHYLDPYSAKGRDKEPSIEEQLQEAKPRLKQLEKIQQSYLKRIDELNKPLSLTIKSDKEVYSFGEPIIITLYLKNTGKEDIFYGLQPFYEQPDFPDYPRVFFQNGENIVVKSKTRGIIEGFHIQQVPIDGGTQMAVVIEPGKEYSQALTISRYFDFAPDTYEIYLENTMAKDKRWGNVNWTGTLTSNTIQIEVRESITTFISKLFAKKLIDVSIKELISNSEKYHGKVVRITGYVQLEFEGTAIYSSKEDAKKNLTKNGLWLSVGGKSVRCFDCKNKFCLIEGTFNRENKGHFNGWSGAIENITRFEEISPGRYCKSNEDCKVVTNYCNCKQECVNKFTELDNCPPRDCKFNYDTQVCYCENNQCVEGPRE